MTPFQEKVKTEKSRTNDSWSMTAFPPPSLPNSKDEESEEEDSLPLLDPEAIDTIANAHFGYNPCGWWVEIG